MYIHALRVYLVVSSSSHFRGHGESQIFRVHRENIMVFVSFCSDIKSLRFYDVFISPGINCRYSLLLRNMAKISRLFKHSKCSDDISILEAQAAHMK